MSLDAFLASCQPLWNAHAAALVVGSLGDPATIANPHIRAHALEGRLFRTVLEELLVERGLPVAIFRERSAYEDCAVTLRLSASALKQRVASLPHPPGPWRAEQKLAALAVWRVPRGPLATRRALG